MLYNANVILNKFLYGKYLLFEEYKYLIYRLYFVGQFVPWYFAKLKKKVSTMLSFLLKPIG